jgi:stage III sporulation protein AG
MMGLLGMFVGKPHTVDQGQGGGRRHDRGQRDSDRRQGGDRVAGAAPSRWLVYGFAALALMWVLGRVSYGLVSLGTQGTGAVPASGPGGLSLGTQTAAAPGTVAAAAGAAGTPSGPRYYEQALAAELESLLSRVKGAGRVAVSLTLSSGPSYVFGNNTTSDTRETEERDSSGSTRTVREVTTSQQPVVLRDSATGERPLVSEESRPGVSGILVLSEGAASPEVRLNLVRAVQALFELPAHRITVLPMGR